MSEVDRPRAEARKRVRKYTMATIGRQILEADGVDNLTPDQKKEMQYSMLIGPITRGLTNYLDGFDGEKPVRKLPGPELVAQIGLRLAREIITELKAYPNYPTLALLAESRAAQFDAPLSDNIGPVGQTIMTASASSANALYDSACANALTIQAVGSYDSREEFIDIVKSSVQLPVARSFVALNWQQTIDEDIFRYAQGQTPPLLEYDPQKRQAVLSLPIEEWPDPLGHSNLADGRVGDIPPADEHIGCPISFDPKLLVRYYEHMVNQLEQHQAWPPVIK